VIEFNYVRLRGYWYPIIPIVLFYSDQKLVTQGLVDSGANFSVFNAQAAEALGIDLRTGKRIELHGLGRAVGYLHQVDMALGKFRFNAHVVFSSELTVSLNILGRSDIFRPFLITFDEQARKVRLDPR
jgi:predicted aspartyl protease